MSIRLRLALWYTAVLGVTLVFFSVLVYLLMDRHFLAERDESIVSRAQHIAMTIRVDSVAPPSLQHVELPPIDAFESPGIYVQVAQTDGAIVAHSDNLGGQQLPDDEHAFAVARSGHAVFYDASVASEQVRVYVQPVIIGGQLIGFVQVGRSYGEANAALASLRLWLISAGVISLLLAGAIGWAAASEALKPVATITRTARAIALSKGFSRRLEDVGTRDELGQLGTTFNEMLASLEQAYAAQQRFIADASHELRTPLTAVGANLELLERQGGNLPTEERRALVTAAAAEANRMARLVAELLSLARADAGQKLEMRPVELDRLLIEVYGEARLLANGVKVALVDIDQISLAGDQDRLRQLILILVDNAIRYTAAGGEVRLSLGRDGATAVLRVADTGVGIPAGDLPHIFERFYRADKGRPRVVPGTGLGLAIAKWIVEQHGGEISVTSKPGSGSTFTVRLPLSPHGARGVG